MLSTTHLLSGVEGEECCLKGQTQQLQGPGLGDVPFNIVSFFKGGGSR